MFSTLYDGVEADVSICVGVITFTLLALMIFVFCLGRRFGRGRCVVLNQASENDLALWQAFGRYLDDFTNIEDKGLPDLSVWREAMVYAVAMGYGSKVAGALRLKYPDAFDQGTYGYDDEWYRLLQEQELYRAMESISQGVADARPPVSASSDDSGSDANWSDSSGDGGGFSDSGGGSDSGNGGDFID